ncbi:MAG: hypothetical protein HQ518_27880 [Rhodopirellula sp.]|nr:hypothetical protein [Rhodopirellula sp.]
MTNEPSSETPASAESGNDQPAMADQPATASESANVAGSTGTAQVRTGSSRCVLIGFAIGCAISLAIIIPAEIDRWNELTGEPGTAWLFDMNVDTTPYAVLFILLPVMWVLRQPLIARPPRIWSRFVKWLGESPRNSPDGSRIPVVLAAMFVACVAAVSCLRVASTPVTADGVAFADLPPAYHDEYSYLFQAETFAAGRLSFPSHPTAARMFDQMHVLNEGHFASRYFPGTGLWIAPFLMLGNPLAAQWLATVIVCVFVFLIGRELSCNGVGLLAGVLAALSPGLVLFGNLLLAHQPTLVGLGLYIYSFLRMQRLLGDAGDSKSDTSINRITVAATLSGIGLSFAMLCRPMTAAGIGLPFGLWLAWWLVRNARQHRQAVIMVVGGFGIPLAIGFGVAAVYNVSTTGSVFTTPYHLYTELFTPRHMFGFNNVERAKPLLTDRTLENYDRWAENLDAKLAVQNVRHRFLASWQWTLGLVALVLSTAVFLAGVWRNLDGRWWLIVAAILSLHAVHVPYWYDGIFHWHYVFESGVLWCLIAAAAVQLLISVFRKIERPWMTVWIGLVLVASVTTNNVAIPPFQGVSRLTVGINQLAFSRLRYFEFQQLLEQRVLQRPALVLVRHDESDRHIDYVTNHPSLSGPVLIGRLPADANASEEETVKLATEAFPGRHLFVFDAKAGRLARIR